MKSIKNKLNKTFILIFMIISVIAASVNSYAAIGTEIQTVVKAKPTNSTVMIDGKKVAFEAYNIAGNNYFKLRDLAQALKESGKKFDVVWDASRNAINLLSNKSYNAVGGELSISGNKEEINAFLTTSRIYLDGNEIALTAYNINDNNYFKLRDVAKSINFGVTWDGSANTIRIDTTIGYAAESANQSTTTAKGYDYDAALAAWKVDFAAKESQKTFDDGSCSTTCTFEWVVSPFIKDGKVYGASRLWYNDVYYAGPKDGNKVSYIALEVYDINNPGVYITVDQLKADYPQF